MSLLPLDLPLADVVGDALRLHIGPTDLPAVASVNVSLGGGRRLLLEVLAASHRATVLVSDVALLTETVACAVEGGSGQSPVDPSRLPLTHTLEGYRFASRRLEGSVALAQEVAEVRRLGDRGDSVVVGFPGHPDALTGLTVGEYSERSVTWRTWHLYPGPTPHVVTTFSQFDLRRAG